MAESSTRTSPYTTCPLLNLPCELRQHIYRYIFNPCPSTIIEACTQLKSDACGSTYIHSSTTSKPTVDNSIIYTNKQLYAEALPVLLSHLHIHISFLSPRTPQIRHPNQPDLNKCFPVHVLQALRTVTYRLPTTTTRIEFGCSQPPKQPFPFLHTPTLNRFRLLKTYHVDISMLRNPMCDGRMTYDYYDRLDQATKLQCWKPTGFTDARSVIGYVARFGSGGWVSALIMPETYGRINKIMNVSREAGGLGMFGGIVVRPGDLSHDGEDESEGDQTGLGVPTGCEVVLEVEVLLYNGPDFVRDHVETMNIIIDLKQKEVTDVKFSKCIDCQRGATMIMNFRERRKIPVHA